MHRGVGPGRARQRPGGAQVEEDPVILPQNTRPGEGVERDHDSCHYRVHSTTRTKGRIATTTWGIITRSCTETHQPRDGNANQWSGPRRRQESSERTPRQGRNPNSQGHAQWTKVSARDQRMAPPVIRLSFRRLLHNHESRQQCTYRRGSCAKRPLLAQEESKRTLGIGASCRLARCKTTGAACLPVNDSRAFSHSLSQVLMSRGGKDFCSGLPWVGTRKKKNRYRLASGNLPRCQSCMMGPPLTSSAGSRGSFPQDGHMRTHLPPKRWTFFLGGRLFLLSPRLVGGEPFRTGLLLPYM